MDNSSPTERICLFPIPGSVTFPGMLFPLHVFEPRYRKMVRQAISDEILLGIGHTDKVIHENKREQSLQEALNSNQSTYKPLPVFSAGYCRLVETKRDGRLMVEVDMQARYRISHCVQTLPFGVYECTRLEDEPLNEASQVICDQLREKILHRLAALTAKSPVLGKNFLDESWFELSPSEFSFQILSLFQMPAPLAQDLLEMTSTEDRLSRIVDTLNF